MPIYEYVCKKRNHRFSELQKAVSTEKDNMCPKCRSGDIKKIFSVFSCVSPGKSLSTSSAPSDFSGGG
jgi:putative FmdB family regulatory protein